LTAPAAPVGSAGIAACESTVLAETFHGGGGGFQIGPGTLIPRRFVYAIQVILLLPILLAAFFAAQNFAADDFDLRGWRFFEPLSWTIPPGLATLLLYGLTEVKILSRDELYPATPRDPLLEGLPFVVVGGLLAIVVVGSVELQKLRARVDAPPVPFAVRKRILFLWVAIVGLLGFLHNSYAMWLFLGAFVYGAGILLPPRGVVPRLVNAAVLIGAAFPFAAHLNAFGREMYLGWRIVWRLVLQTAYGVWSPMAVSLFFMSLVLWVQLFWISVLARERQPEP
jgi:hypothetical protein